MADPLRKTFDFLATAANPFAPEVLIAAMDVSDSDIASRAVQAILKRGDNQGFKELVRRFDTFPAETRDAIAKSAARMEPALREILIGGETTFRQNAFQLVEQAEVFSMTGTLLTLMRGEPDLADVAMQTVFVLAERLYDKLRSSDNSASSDEKPGVRNRTRQAMLKSLMQDLEDDLTARPCRARLESLLIIGSFEDASVRELFSASAHPVVQKAAWDLLRTSTHAGVLQFLVAAMSRRQADDRLLSIFQDRDDVEFALHQLRAFPRRLSTSARENLRQLKSVGWIDAAQPDLDWVPAGLQGRLVDIVAAMGMKQSEKLNILQWMVRHGGIAGRVAAVSVLSTMNIDSVDDAIRGGLNSDDTDVQAWATSQLREANIPEAFSMLIERLDSDIPEVQSAAREELESFDLNLMLGLFDQLKPEVCRRAGSLMCKIHSDTQSILTNELKEPIRRKKERAIHATRAMGLQHLVTDTLLELLDDDDLMIRRSVIDSLSDIPSLEIRAVLLKLQEDESERIRDAAASALKRNDAMRKAAAAK